MKKAIADVEAFSVACEVYTPTKGCGPHFPPPRVLEHRMDILAEEYRELGRAVFTRDLVGVADGIADCIYILIGTARACGIPLDKVWDEVQRSNMDKVDPVLGKAVKDKFGKVTKPLGWQPPNIAGIIQEAQYDAELAA